MVADRDQVPDLETLIAHLREELAVLTRWPPEPGAGAPSVAERAGLD